jgi:MFS transporter, SHS family, sialic acid transporter
VNRTDRRGGKWTALTAAFLGWMFGGVEMGLFPLAARPALQDLLTNPSEGEIGRWFALMTAAFLVGAAAGGVLFGWLGDRLGRVRAMGLSILTYSIFTGLCGLASSAELVLVYRFISSLGIGGEWSLGVSLVMELWPSRSRGWLAGLIGAAANVGFILIAILGLALTPLLTSLESLFLAVGLSEQSAAALVSNSGWRILMLSGAVPILLVPFVRWFVPESERWLHEHGSGRTRHWARADLFGVLLGTFGPLLMIFLWAGDFRWPVRIAGSLFGLAIAIGGYTFPVIRYLSRSGERERTLGAGDQPVLKLMLLGAVLSGVALLGSWGSMQWAPAWADQLTGGEQPHAKAYTQIALGIGAIVGTIVAAVVSHRFGRRSTYAALCLLSFGSALLFYLGNDRFGVQFLLVGFLAGGITAAFYGWLPLYLPELFPTRVRATGQGFAFNFGRILAAVGSLQTGALMNQVFDGSYPKACSVMSGIYLVGLVAIWFVPETHRQELIE